MRTPPTATRWTRRAALATPLLLVLLVGASASAQTPAQAEHRGASTTAAKRTWRGRFRLFKRRGDRQRTSNQQSRTFISDRSMGQLGDASTATLVFSGAGRLAQLSVFAGPLTGVGAVGLGLYSMHQLVRAKQVDRRLDAMHGLAWSLQGLAGLTRWGMKMPSLGATLGVAGGVLQAGVGLYRLRHGFKNNDRERKVIGALDTAAGTAWALSALSIATPVTLGAFFGLTAARLAYTNREWLRDKGAKVARRVRTTAQRVRSSVGRRVRSAGNALRSLGQRLLGKGQPTVAGTTPAAPLGAQPAIPGAGAL